ncbi:MAG TPA: glycosyltransferase family 39 protein [Tepidisphaeraceae bacterium]
MILLVAAALRVYRVDSQSLWMDELFSMECSSGYAPRTALQSSGMALTRLDPTSLGNSWWQVWTSVAREENQPPLYFLVLRLWRDIFGDSDGALRSLSITASLSAIILLFLVVLELHDATSALWAAALMAVASPQIKFAQEARSYMLLTALSLGALLVVVRLHKRGPSRRRSVALSLCAAAMLLTHYLALAPLAAIGLYGGLVMSGKARRQIFRSLALAGLLFSVLCLPFLWGQRDHFAGDTAWLLEGGKGELVRILQRAAVMPARYLIQPSAGHLGIAALGAAGYLLLLLLARRDRSFLIWSFWLGCPILVAAALDLSRSSWTLDLVRYTLVAAPAMYLLIATVGRQHRFFRHAIPAVVLLACLLELPNTYTPYKADFRGLARFVQDRAQPGDAIVFSGSDTGDWYEDILYLGMSHYMHHMPGPIIFLHAPTDAKALAQLRSTRNVWLIEKWRGNGALQTLDSTQLTATMPFPGLATVSQLVLTALPDSLPR